MHAAKRTNGAPRKVADITPTGLQGRGLSSADLDYDAIAEHYTSLHTKLVSERGRTIEGLFERSTSEQVATACIARCSERVRIRAEAHTLVEAEKSAKARALVEAEKSAKAKDKAEAEADGEATQPASGSGGPGDVPHSPTQLQAGSGHVSVNSTQPPSPSASGSPLVPLPDPHASQGSSGGAAAERDSSLRSEMVRSASVQVQPVPIAAPSTLPSALPAGSAAGGKHGTGGKPAAGGGATTGVALGIGPAAGLRSRAASVPGALGGASSASEGGSAASALPAPTTGPAHATDAARAADSGRTNADLSGADGSL